MYINFLCIPQVLSFFSLFFLSISKLASPLPAPSNKQTFAKIDFEISIQRTYLKKLGTRNAAGGVGDVTENRKIMFYPLYN